MYKNYGISRVGNYASLRGVKVSKLNQKGNDLTTPFIDPEIVEIKGRIGEDIIVNSINQGAYYDVYADCMIFYVGNVDSRANYLKIEMNCGEFSTSFYSLNLSSFEINREYGSDSSFTFDYNKDIEIHVKSVNEELGMESENVICLVRFQKNVEAPVIDSVFIVDGGSSTQISPDSDGIYEIPLLTNNNLAFLSCLLHSDCIEKASECGNNIINSQVIEISYEDINDTIGLYYNFDLDKELGTLILPKDYLLMYGLSNENLMLMTSYNFPITENLVSVIAQNYVLPLNTEIKIKIYLAKDSGTEIRSDYSNEITIKFIADDNSYGSISDTMYIDENDEKKSCPTLILEDYIDGEKRYVETSVVPTNELSTFIEIDEQVEIDECRLYISSSSLEHMYFTDDIRISNNRINVDYNLIEHKASFTYEGASDEPDSFSNMQIDIKNTVVTFAIRLKTPSENSGEYDYGILSNTINVFYNETSSNLQ